MNELMDKDVIRVANSARKKEYQKIEEELKGKKLENKRIVERKRVDAKRFLLFNAVGSLVLVSVISMGAAYSQAKAKLIRSRGGSTSIEYGTGYATEKLPEGISDPTFGEVLEFMFDEIKGVGKGR